MLIEQSTLSIELLSLSRRISNLKRENLGQIYRRNYLLSRWKRLPREAVDIPSMEVFKARLDVSLNSLV